MIRAGSLEEELVAFSFAHHSGTFAAGQEANNKLELDYTALSRNPDLLARVMQGMVGLATPYQPRFVVGVPNGATDLAEHMAREMGISHVALHKDPDTKQISYYSEDDMATVLELGHGIMVEDVMNRLTSTERSLQVEHLAPRIAAVLGMFRRGLPGLQRPVGKPVHALATHPIPDMLPKTSSLWKYAA